VSEPAAAPVAEAMEPVAEPVPAIELPPAHRRSEIPIERGFPLKWVPITGLTAAVVLGAFVLRRPDARIETPTPETVSPPAVAGPAPVRENPPKPSPAPRSTQPPAPAQSRDRTATGDARPSTTSPVWRVIAYTYNGRSNAEKKARSLNEKRPGWHAEVFTPKGDRAPYFVSLGGRMTLAEAERVQRDARAKGLPRDTFVRNFTN
jgi:hypothetical protein